MSEEVMSLEAFREAKASGVDLYAEPSNNAAEAVDVDADYAEEDLPDYEQEHEDYDDEVNSTEGTLYDSVDDDPHPEERDEDGLTPREQTAFEKRRERDARKIREEVEAEYEAKYGVFKQLSEAQGITPEMFTTAFENLNQQNVVEQLVYNQGWDEQQARQYAYNQSMMIKQQIQDEAVNNPKLMSAAPAITQMMQKHPGLTPTQAMYALGGDRMIEQERREAEQRERANRSQSRRTVLSDAPNTFEQNNDGINDDDAIAAKKMGISVNLAHKLRTAPEQLNLETYRNLVKSGRKAK